jgi:hypothetical protein
LTLHELLQLLHSATGRGNLSWADTADETTFRAALGVGLVRDQWLHGLVAELRQRATG